jgi:hypothetical protein
MGITSGEHSVSASSASEAPRQQAPTGGHAAPDELDDNDSGEESARPV